MNALRSTAAACAAPRAPARAGRTAPPLRAALAAALAAAILAPAAPAPAQERAPVDPRLGAVLRALESELRERHSARALRVARQGIENLLESGPATAEAPAIARLLYYQAVAAADRGLDDTASWSWSLAQSLDPELAGENLGRWGEAGTFLAARPARPPVQDGDVVPEGEQNRPGRLNLFTAPAAVTTRLPEEIDTPPPPYPPSLRGSGSGGTVLLQVRLDRRGGPNDPVVLESPHPILSLAAAEAVNAWRYRPAAVDGDAVGVYYTVRIDFRAE
jgi:TonB family protein